MNSESRELRVVVTGDVCPYGALEEAFIDTSALGFVTPVLPLFSRADLVIGNLEIPLSDCSSPIEKYGTGPNFMASTDVAVTLKNMGFDILTLANNHIMDQGLQGLESTLQALASHEISTCGAGMSHSDACRPAIAAIGDYTVAVLNFAEGEFAQAKEDGPGAARLEPYWSASRVAGARREFDFVIVILHLGNEALPIPSDVTVSACRAMAHAGAHAVLAHHPHFPQCCEIYEGVPICYSLGNFLFGPRRDPERVLRYSPGWYLSLVAELAFSLDECTLLLHPFKQHRDLSLGLLSKEGRTAFDEYMALNRAIVSSPRRHKQLWDQEARNLFRGFPQRLEKYADDLNSSDPWGRRRSAAILHELFRTDAHHARVERGLRLICDGQEQDDPAAQGDLRRLYRLMRTCIGAIE